MPHQKEVTYLRPESLAEAWQALDQMQGAAQPVWVSPEPPDPAGLALESYVDLSALDLGLIKESDDRLTIGAGARLRAIQDSEIVAKAYSGMILRAVRKTGHQGLRNLASLGAVLLDPASAPEFASALLAGDPKLVYFDGEKKSIQLAEAWSNGAPQGLPLELQFDRKLAADSKAAIEWVGRSPMDKSMVTVAASIVPEGGNIRQVQLAAAGDGFGPQLLQDTNQKLADSSLTDLDRSAFTKWVQAEIKPTASYRASVDYQLEVAPILAWRALQAASGEVK